MTLAFFLSMPGCPSWNGKWSGDGRKYVIVKTFRGAKQEANAQGILLHGCYHYRWDDGWSAAIEVVKVEKNEAASLRRTSDGFCGYDWMVDTIVAYGKIMDSIQVQKHLTQKAEVAR